MASFHFNLCSFSYACLSSLQLTESPNFVLFLFLMFINVNLRWIFCFSNVLPITLTLYAIDQMFKFKIANLLRQYLTKNKPKVLFNLILKMCFHFISILTSCFLHRMVKTCLAFPPLFAHPFTEWISIGPTPRMSVSVPLSGLRHLLTIRF